MKISQLNHYVIAFFKENLTYKLLSLLIAMMLWFVVFNRKEYIIALDMQVQAILSPDQSVLIQTADKIRVRLSGPRNLINSFRDSALSKNLRIDLSRRGEGTFEVDINSNMIDAPRGIKILSIRPNLIRLEVRSKSKPEIESSPALETEAVPPSEPTSETGS